MRGQLTPGPITAQHQATPGFLRGSLGPHNVISPVSVLVPRRDGKQRHTAYPYILLVGYLTALSVSVSSKGLGIEATMAMRGTVQAFVTRDVGSRRRFSA
jgi:hypothetical protein